MNLYRLNSLSTWRSYKHHVPLLEDQDIKDRLSKILFPSSTLPDPFTYDIRKQSDSAMHLQNLHRSEVRSLLFIHVDDVISKEYKIAPCSLFLKITTTLSMTIERYKDSIGFE